ncbi:hypothetical protein F441_08575 [Phytophthora nicotianae CJ01A1]|uniref:DET1- and DDB1-associated protein 1 domain-containing protein n=5 Tax=Phytophthora nicotianae TaxID=4792 RepID=V9F8N7_PHYNI|nr:hypothetical protein F443_08601 [Phytophthora nicotianae P1569]ETK87057.1 hypothetical protein L915_08428 [Phytophthora nicotianae]ETO75815.1 hypothetical protein F444_08669 [Phytophthora nicotianae P1976]ETP16917.1 hypothetical protein F441_08575 [Phytophthora nicotianae CJ01A1]ETP44966.1 hypothetical protein F442_08541 [Phytophthora nicotianae P10297]
MAFTNEKRWPAAFRLDRLEEKAPAMNSMAAWPTSSAANFSRLPQEPGVKMIVTPKAYYATHNTMPPPNQVILMTSTHSVMREQYQAADRKVSGKRGNGEQNSSSPRPPKQFRPCE